MISTGMQTVEEVSVSKHISTSIQVDITKDTKVKSTQTDEEKFAQERRSREEKEQEKSKKPVSEDTKHTQSDQEEFKTFPDAIFSCGEEIRFFIGQNRKRTLQKWNFGWDPGSLCDSKRLLTQVTPSAFDLAPEDRQKIVEEHAKCWKCMSSQHWIDDCPLLVLPPREEVQDSSPSSEVKVGNIHHALEQTALVLPKSHDILPPKPAANIDQKFSLMEWKKHRDMYHRKKGSKKRMDTLLLDFADLKSIRCEVTSLIPKRLKIHLPLPRLQGLIPLPSLCQVIRLYSCFVSVINKQLPSHRGVNQLLACLSLTCLLKNYNQFYRVPNRLPGSAV